MGLMAAILASLYARSQIEDDDEDVSGYSLSDFPQPDFSTPVVLPDSRTCYNNAKQYNQLADLAESCGYDALAEQYRILSERWYLWYENAQLEEDAEDETDNDDDDDDRYEHDDEDEYEDDDDEYEDDDDEDW